MFTHLNKATALMPSDVIVINTINDTRSISVKRGADLLAWTVPEGSADFWGYFCQLVKSPEDAEGAASALAAAAGHAIKRLDDRQYEVIAFVPKKEKKK